MSYGAWRLAAGTAALLVGRISRPSVGIGGVQCSISYSATGHRNGTGHWDFDVWPVVYGDPNAYVISRNNLA